jgi:hypothetical protein
VVAGGGFQGGHVVGASDDKGEQVKERPVYPSDVIRGIYELLGIDPDGTVLTPQGQSVPITPSTWEGSKTAGRLTEIT